MTQLVAPVHPSILAPGWSRYIDPTDALVIVVGLGLLANLAVLAFTVGVNVYVLTRARRGA